MEKAKVPNVKSEPSYSKFALIHLETRQILYTTVATSDEIYNANSQLIIHSPQHYYVFLETVER